MCDEMFKRKITINVIIFLWLHYRKRVDLRRSFVREEVSPSLFTYRFDMGPYVFFTSSKWLYMLMSRFIICSYWITDYINDGKEYEINATECYSRGDECLKPDLKCIATRMINFDLSYRGKDFAHSR